MLELLNYTFFTNALLIGVLSGIACGIIGSFVVIKKISFISGSIAHASFGGIGLAYFWVLVRYWEQFFLAWHPRLGLGYQQKE
jgi:zinc transport system permease protein